MNKNELSIQSKNNYNKFKPAIFALVAILIQSVVLIVLYFKYSHLLYITSPLWVVLSTAFMIYVINREADPTYKLAWILIVAVMPIFGILLYLLLQFIPGRRSVHHKLEQNILESKLYNLQDSAIKDRLIQADKQWANTAQYLNDFASAPTFTGTATKYYAIGEDYFADLLSDLQRAKRSIMMEYFIISPGKLWSSIEAILIEKAKAGVDVKLMYDGTNSINLPVGFFKPLEDAHVKVNEFSPISAFLNTVLNNRDHRKITVIDNTIGYTGGVNLADEYANIIDRFGHWKDTGLRLEGPAVQSLTMTFLQLWNLPEPIEEYSLYTEAAPLPDQESFVVPFADDPNDLESVAENIFVDVLSRARHYVYIMTPYLILSDHMSFALKLAAKRGIDVRIIMPHIPDKRIPFLVAQTYYPDLIKAGVKIYQYRPGFVHAKVVLSDDIVSIVGTINCDYRSFHHHYENGVLSLNRDLALTIKSDFASTLEACYEMSFYAYKKLPLKDRILGKIFRIFAPLM
ncbi:cardiolipin synthase [Peptoniphilus equinus]|uniref:Cardiolipin synthase n=1 Tax=Peptoniphilus equinus TaxID=3016343 RepID=A0ABY7QTW8_9FIRM|nr:cardiolipin synthase [Peptoniphilus equinus]WBW49333.1 cardiolipin synthase [Peptoniphilus equinus]